MESAAETILGAIRKVKSLYMSAMANEELPG